MPLSDVKVRNAKPRGTAYKLADAGGLYLFISPSGGRLWRWNYRLERKCKTMSLGRYPEISLAEAREKHEAARKLLAVGSDPMVEKG